MSKKRPQEKADAEPHEESASEPIADKTSPSANGSNSAELGHLENEVQSFLARRAELIDRLNQEIEATERKLVELKKTVASLQPPTDGDNKVDKDRAARKLKKPAKSAPTSTAPDSPAPSTPISEAG